MRENSMGGAPFGQATREELGSLGYEQMLREQYPEEFARGRLYGSEAFPTDIASLYAARPGRSAFTQIAGREAGAAGGPRAIRGAGTPALTYEPVQGPTINAGFEVPRGMNRFEANQYYFTHGIPGEDIYRRSNYGGELGFTPRGRAPSPPGEPIEMGAPYWPNAVPRDMGKFQANTYGMTYGRPGNEMYRYSNMDFVPENVPGQFGPLAPRASTMPVVQQGGVPAVRGGLPTMAQGEWQGPYGAYGEFRDVTGNVLQGPAEAPYAGGMDFGVMREGAASRGGIPFGKIAAGAAGLGIPLFAAYESQRQPAARTEAGRPVGSETSRGRAELPPIDIRGREAQGAKMAPESKAGGSAMPKEGTKAPKKGTSKVPTPPKRPSEMSPAEQQDFEGNLNYYVTKMLDELTGQQEAERGRRHQQYYEQYR
jgi:hypothetical protein